MSIANPCFPVLDPKHFKCNEFDYILDRSGGMGDVLKAFDTRLNETVAVKIIKLERKNRVQESEEEGKQHQIVTSCPHVINFIGMFYQKELTGLVMEYAVNGSLERLIYSEYTIPKDLKLRFLHEIISGIHFLHSFGVDQRVLHRDIKPKNILLDGDFHAKICDFGASVCNTVTEKWQAGREKKNRSAMTLVYSAPERLLGHPSTSKMDIYSFAITSWEIVVCQRPYSSNGQQWVRENVVDGGRPSTDNFPKDLGLLRNIIKRCWDKEPTSRPDAKTIKKALMSNCPFDYRNTAFQVAELLKALPKRQELTEDMAERSLIEIVDVTFNQRTEAPSTSHPSPNTHQHAAAHSQFGSYPGQGRLVQDQTYVRSKSQNVRMPSSHHGQQFYGSSQYNSHRENLSARQRNASFPPQSYDSEDRYNHENMLHEQQQPIPANERSNDFARSFEPEPSSSYSPFNPLLSFQSKPARMSSNFQAPGHQSHQQSSWNGSASSFRSPQQQYHQSAANEEGLLGSAYTSPPSSMQTGTSYVKASTNQNMASMSSNYSQSQAPQQYSSSQTLSSSFTPTSSFLPPQGISHFPTPSYPSHNRVETNQNESPHSSQSGEGKSNKKSHPKRGVMGAVTGMTRVLVMAVQQHAPSKLQSVLPLNLSAMRAAQGSISQTPTRVIKKNKLRCLVLGNESIGKGNMIKMFKSANKNQVLTVGKQQHKVEVVSGEGYMAMVYDVVIICFSPASRNSYMDVEKAWLRKHHNSPYNDAPVLLVMTQTEKMPLDRRGVSSNKFVTEEECQALKKKFNDEYEEYSTNKKIQAKKIFKRAFTMAADKL